MKNLKRIINIIIFIRYFFKKLNNNEIDSFYKKCKDFIKKFNDFFLNEPKKKTLKNFLKLIVFKKKQII
jgi:hypothetical protein